MTEDLNELLGDHLMEPLQERVDLLLDHSVHLEVAQLLQIVELVLVCDQSFTASWNQVFLLMLSEVVQIDAEVHTLL